MTCRQFERQAADWISGRLSPERTEEMTAHPKTCAACARAALAEREFQESWRRGIGSPTTSDIWPQIASQLEEQEQIRVRKPQTVGRLRWAMAVALALAALGIYHGSRLPIEPSGTKSSIPERTAAASVQSHVASWSALGKLAQDDPAVDDPVGTSMEPLWICLKTDGK